MRIPLPPAFLSTPIAHRALHDKTAGRPENSRAAAQAAVDAGYGIEIDLQLSSDGVAMVFHDEELDRLTAASGPVNGRTAAELGQIALLNGTEGIPTLAEMLGLIRGRVPLLIEIKDQDGAMGKAVGPLEQATAQALAGYGGPVALMSFNPHSVAELAHCAPHLPRGLTTSSYDPADWAPLPATTCDHLRGIPDYDRVAASFISHQWNDLSRPRVSALRAQGAAVLCWTIRSVQAEAEARKHAQNITFEGYAAAFPA